ncbi:hypothetical protein JXL83_07620 [candidate division WOR-3 bacterium]|nr:hypothetical protein [candidate division WOR-3 bacterium]
MIDGDIKEILKEIQKMRKIGEHERALEVIENLYKSEKDMDKGVTAFLQYQKGLIYSKRKEKEKAMDAFAIAIDNSKSATQKVVIQAANSEVLGHNVDAYFSLKNLSLQKSSAGERNMADSLIKEMLTTNRILKKSIEFVEKLDETKIDDAAAEEIGSLLSVSKNDPYLWTLFGKYYAGKAQYDKALNCYEKGSESQLKKFESLVGAIHCHIMLGNIEIAKINLKAAKDTAKTEQQIADLDKISQAISKLKPSKSEETPEEDLLIEHTIIAPPPPPEKESAQLQEEKEEDDFREGDLVAMSQVSAEIPEKSTAEKIEPEPAPPEPTPPEPVPESLPAQKMVPPPPPDEFEEGIKTEEQKKDEKTLSFDKFQEIDEIEKSYLWDRGKPEKKTPDVDFKKIKKYEAKLSFLNSAVSIIIFLSFAAGTAAGVVLAMRYF